MVSLIEYKFTLLFNDSSFNSIQNVMVTPTVLYAEIYLKLKSVLNLGYYY